jgi:hypothetical protein
MKTTMMTTLPLYIPIIFIIAVLLTLQLLIKATPSRQNAVLLASLCWLGFNGILAWYGFFANILASPPRLLLATLPVLLAIILLFITRGGITFISKLDLGTLTLLHLVRLPVELVLYWLSVYKLVPELLTFEGRNFDIISGLTAPIVYFICFKDSRMINKKILLCWNIVSLGLLLNVVVSAVLSAPYPFQQFAFEQPNTAVLYFPFIWLPCFIVMVIVFTHLVAFKQILKPG